MLLELRLCRGGISQLNHARIPRSIYFALFTVSGFAGLIYESIWSHYLKLFLGHAAYAQTLVLALFMGGMAIGAWIASRYSGRWKNLLVGYALTEGVIGLAALAFHDVYLAATGAAYNWALPAIVWLAARGRDERAAPAAHADAHRNAHAPAPIAPYGLFLLIAGLTG